MPIKRLFVEHPLAAGARLVLDGDAAHYLGRVLRARPGDPLTVFNGDGAEYAATVHDLARGSVTLDVSTTIDAMAEPPVAITLLQALSRNEKMDVAIQKAVELGAAEIRPVAVERSVMRLDDERAARRAAHWRQVAVHAAQQCGRAIVPAVHAPVPLDDVLAAGGLGFGIVADPDAGQTLATTLAGAPRERARISLLVGPEGGLTAQEIAAAAAAGMRPSRAGPRVLRTETAAVALLAILQWHFGDFGGGAAQPVRP